MMVPGHFRIDDAVYPFSFELVGDSGLLVPPVKFLAQNKNKAHRISVVLDAEGVNASPAQYMDGLLPDGRSKDTARVPVSFHIQRREG
ncbi:hypothetical protein [Cribrihabitans marinus]|uniref:hypothetical protein n=1 Tax=Cribrihabitans marinus TaxID=1227549 RepID=UPI00116006C1|nr:hypothetical protein [Cribrihabitans marinus]GGH17758.1 hypothetical protein GCM10010973_00100 [Cribrihabitans marinus]